MPADVETMFSHRDLPWHRIGVVTEDALTAADALVTAGLDWRVLKVPAKADLGASLAPAPSHFFTVRETDSKVLGHVRSDYQVFQNRDAFAFADGLVDDGEARYETAGSLGGGRIVWMTMKMPGHVLVGGEEAVEMYLLLTNSHDGTRKITAAVTPVKVVCRNTLNLALNRATRRWLVRHVGTAQDKLAEARAALTLTFRYVESFEAVANRLAEQAFTNAEFTALVEAILPELPQKPNKVAELVDLFENSPTMADSLRRTKWGALNTVGEYYDWTRHPEAGPLTEESQVIGTWTGVGYKARNKALELLTA